MAVTSINDRGELWSRQRVVDEWLEIDGTRCKLSSIYPNTHAVTKQLAISGTLLIRVAPFA